MCYRIDGMCYHLRFNNGINKVLLPGSLQNYELTYVQENKYCMYNGYLYIEPCLLAHCCTRWAHLSSCARCHLQAETQKHCLWECIESQLVWQHLRRIFANYFPPLVFTWGTVIWTSLDCYAFH